MRGPNFASSLVLFLRTADKISRSQITRKIPADTRKRHSKEAIFKNRHCSACPLQSKCEAVYHCREVRCTRSPGYLLRAAGSHGIKAAERSKSAKSENQLALCGAKDSNPYRTEVIALCPHHRESPGSRACSGPSQGPRARDRVVVHGALQNKRVAAGGSRCNGQLKCPRDISVHGPVHTERPGLCSSRSKAGGRRRETEIRASHHQRTSVLRQGSRKGEGRSSVRVGQRRRPIAGSGSRTTRIPTTARGQRQT